LPEVFWHFIKNICEAAGFEGDLALFVKVYARIKTLVMGQGHAQVKSIPHPKGAY